MPNEVKATITQIPRLCRIIDSCKTSYVCFACCGVEAEKRRLSHILYVVTEFTAPKFVRMSGTRFNPTTFAVYSINGDSLVFKRVLDRLRNLKGLMLPLAGGSTVRLPVLPVY